MGTHSIALHLLSRLMPLLTSYDLPLLCCLAAQTTTVKLASPAVEMYTKLSPSSVSGNTLTLGPYKDIQGGAA